MTWHRNYTHTDVIGTYTSEQADYVSADGRYTIQKINGYTGILWTITRNEDHRILDAMPTLRSAKMYCESE